MFQTPSAGRWVLQPDRKGHQVPLDHRFKPHQRGGGCCNRLRPSLPRRVLLRSFKPHQRGGGCCNTEVVTDPKHREYEFQTPSAGRWVLQLAILGMALTVEAQSFKPHQRGGGCCNRRPLGSYVAPVVQVSNPISGEVGAATGRPPKLPCR